MPQAARPTWKDWLPVISVAVMLIGALLAAGGMLNQQNDNTRRLDKLEVKDDAKEDKLNTIDRRTVRIETKIEMLLPADGKRDPMK